MMELSNGDIARLTGKGFKKEEICILGEDGIPRLRNVDGRCVFLSKDGGTCMIYEHRPTGCDIYPVNCDEDGNIFVDEFCKAKRTVSKEELRRKGADLKAHLRMIDEEARSRKRKVTRSML